VDLGRILKHLCVGRWKLRRAFPKHSLRTIGEAIRDAETGHCGEIRFAVEPSLNLKRLLTGQSARERALEVFSLLRVWDTEQNSGVLIYLLLADRRVEIVADRGIHARVSREEWEQICHEMESALHAGNFEAGAVSGIKATGAHLARHFPSGDERGDELSNRPVIL
jgi:hypothetical protein